jgi:hypothetical protein
MVAVYFTNGSNQRLIAAFRRPALFQRPSIRPGFLRSFNRHRVNQKDFRLNMDRQFVCLIAMASKKWMSRLRCSPVSPQVNLLWAACACPESGLSV